MSGVLPHQRPIAPIQLRKSEPLDHTPDHADWRRRHGGCNCRRFRHAGARPRVDVNSREDMVLFVLLSSALTGIAPEKLAPGIRLQPSNPPTVPPPPIDLSKSIAGSDPVNIKRE